MWILKGILILVILGVTAFSLRNKKKGIREMVCAIVFLMYSFFVKSPEVVVLGAIILFITGIYMFLKENKQLER